ncbi:MAG: hypothetical protein R6X02_07045 [Enhygromyxa sp.]
MSRLIRTISKLPLTCLPMLALLASGCASFKLKDPPPGFIEVSHSEWGGDAELRMKAPDNVGLNITTFSNQRGGTLPLWSTDMVKKLAGRGYTLERQTAVKSGNGVEGTRFDFSYTPRGSDNAEEKFYTAVLFVTDKWQVVVQLAGNESLAADHAGDVERIIKEIKVRGCKVGSKVCKAGQPQPLLAPGVGASKTKPNGPGPDAAAAGDQAEQPEPAAEQPEPAAEPGD